MCVDANATKKGKAIMKKGIVCLVLVFIMLLAGCGNAPNISNDAENEKQYIQYGTYKNDVNGTAMQIVAENDQLILSANYDTTDIAVTVKSTGYVWKSSGDGSDDGIGKSIKFSYLQSNGTVAYMDSWNDSVKKGQYSIEPIENGIHIVYSFGDIANDLIYPTYIDADRYNLFVSKMSSRKQGIITSQYRHLAPDLYSDDMYESFLKDFPKAKNKDVYVLRSTDMLMTAKQELSQAFADAGYTIEDLQKENKEFSLDTDVQKTKNVQFNIGVDYIIDGGNLTVKLPKEECYSSSAVTGIETLQLMQYFGSPKNGSDGYFLLPDGSGSIMNFYNGKESALQTVNTQMYGENYAITQNENIYNLDQAIFPVFGEKNSNNAFISVIEEGDNIAGVNAVSGTDTMSARIWPEFRIMDSQATYPKSLSDSSYYTKSSYVKEQPQPYSGEIRLKYHFLSNSEADYSGMARYYRDYLFGSKSSIAKECPLYLELVSGIDYKENVFGFTHNTVSTITTFDQAAQIATELKNNGISREKLILSGWQSTGWRNDYVNKSQISKAAGGKEGLLNLASVLNKNDISFYPEADVQFVYSSALKGNVNKNTVGRTIVQQLTQKFTYNYSDYQKESMIAYALTPESSVNSIVSYTNILDKLGIKSASLRYLSKYIIPDYNDNSVVNREETTDLLTKACTDAENSGYSFISRGGNAPYLNLLSDAIEMPLHSTGNNNSAYEIPFTSMVLSGNIEYAYEPINLSGSDSKDILKLIESNSGVYCLLAGTRDDNIKESYFNDWHSIAYEDQKDNVTECYSKVNNALTGVYGTKINRHDRLADNVYKITYENGIYIIVNYNEFDVTVDGVTVKACGFAKGDVQ